MVLASNATFGLYECSGCGLEISGFANDTPSLESIQRTVLSTSNIPSFALSSAVLDDLQAQNLITSRALESLKLRIEKLSNSLKTLQEDQKYLEEKNAFSSPPFTPFVDYHPKFSQTFFSSAPNSKKLAVMRRTFLGASTPARRLNLSWTRTPDYIESKRTNLLEPVLALQLQRCRERPITLSYHSGPDTDERLKEQLALHLCSRSLQWERVSLEGNVKAFAPLCRYQGLFPSLTTLRVHFLKDDWAGDSVFTAFDRLPSLERFSVIGDTTAVIRRGDLFSWDKILHYSAREDTECVPNLVDHYQVLPRLTNVQTCTLDTCLPDSLHDEPPPQPTLSLPFLHTLVLTQSSALDIGGISPLLNWLVLPALRVLRFPYGFDCPRALVDFLDRSQCSLEELTIVNMGETALTQGAVDDFIQVLEAPSLQRLSTLGFGGVAY
ncbi:hypothetical protein PQX77_011239 [Marasmius sp. AFHP31]|nr:hypothetical protein PQX77_011239 [Marasmius sp. AFHP31]